MSIDAHFRSRMLTGGSTMPVGWKSPLRDANRQPLKLYQVIVEQTDGKPLRVGPVWLKDSAGALCEAINRAIISGHEKLWSNPTVVLVN